MDRVEKHDWNYVDVLSKEHRVDRLRKMSVEEKFRVYADMYNAIWRARKALSLDKERLAAWRWEQKQAIRVRMASAFAKLDELKRERSASKNPA